MRAEQRFSLIGDKQFYRKVFMITIPIIVQNGITTFVGLLDNIMVGQVGTEQMSGVAIANQLVFILIFVFSVRWQVPVFWERSFTAAGTMTESAIPFALSWWLVWC